ncbi:MAG: purine-nucleoside phosphorylase, partial [Erysipelotrichaceae bacterium]|nr:purine-nucleoside phosphorylase [Erysipelotrichaceae bacterium]
MATPHINAKEGAFANIVLMPGDPLRAKWIAETYLHDFEEVTNVRGILGYTGYTKNGKRISVMASGMGQPSIGIYSHELYTGYGVEAIIRVGTCGSYQPEINLFDVLIATTASTDSNWQGQNSLNGTLSAGADFELAIEAYNQCKVKG